MPELTNLNVDAVDLRVEDLVDDSDLIVRGASRVRDGRMVTSVKVGTTNVTIETTGGTIVVHRDAILCIRRFVPTAAETATAEAEQRAKNLEFAQASAFRTCQQSFARVEATTAKLAEAAKWRVDSQWSPLNDHLAALAERDIWLMVLAPVGSTWTKDRCPTCGVPFSDEVASDNCPVPEQHGDVERVTFLDAMREVAKDLTEALVSNRWRGSSSSDVSNACERAMAAAASAWLRSYGVRGLLHYADEQ